MTPGGATVHQVVAVAGHAERVARAVVWARTGVRVAPATTSGWAWVAPDPDVPTSAPMTTVVDEASAEGTAVLVTVAPRRSEVQVWRDEKQVAVVGVDAGRVAVRDHDEAADLARRLCSALPGADERTVTSVLRTPRSAGTAWLDLVRALGVPVPSAAPGPAWTLQAAADVVTVSAAGSLREAGRVAGGRAPLTPVPDTEPKAWWRTVLRVVVIVAVGWLVVDRLLDDEPRYVAIVGAALGAASLVPGLLTAIRRRRARARARTVWPPPA